MRFVLPSFPMAMDNECVCPGKKSRRKFRKISRVEGTIVQYYGVGLCFVCGCRKTKGNGGDKDLHP